MQKIEQEQQILKTDIEELEQKTAPSGLAALDRKKTNAAGLWI